MEQKKYWGKTVASFFLVLCTMPPGHALMKITESAMPATFGIWMMFMVVYLYQYELRLPCIQLASESPFPREKT